MLVTGLEKRKRDIMMLDLSVKRAMCPFFRSWTLLNQFSLSLQTVHLGTHSIWEKDAQFIVWHYCNSVVQWVALLPYIFMVYGLTLSSAYCLFGVSVEILTVSSHCSKNMLADWLYQTVSRCECYPVQGISLCFPNIPGGSSGTLWPMARLENLSTI